MHYFHLVPKQLLFFILSGGRNDGVEHTSPCPLSEEATPLNRERQFFPFFMVAWVSFHLQVPLASLKHSEVSYLISISFLSCVTLADSVAYVLVYTGF